MAAREMNRTADAHARQKKHIRQRVHDSATGYLNLLEDQIHRPGYMDRRIIMPNSNFKRFMSASVPEAWNEANAMTTRAARAHKNKISCKINKAKWTPDNRRLVTGTATGEFTFWDGMTFQFETIYRTHGTEAMPLAVRAMEWSHNARWLISSDVEGNVKYWSHQWEPSKAFEAHERSACRDLSFSPTDAKFASCGDDKTVRVWDFATSREEQCMSNHTYDVQSVDWHPFSSLIASGSRDKTVKLWDPRQGKEVHEYTDHSQQVSAVQWNQNGQWLLTTSRDKSVRLYDLRTLKELQLFNCSELSHSSSIGWHPFHERVFASGHYDGRLCFWRVGEDEPSSVVQSAHDQDIATLDWHPNGHALATAGMDTFTKVWIRQRPGDSTKQYTYEGNERMQFRQGMGGGDRGGYGGGDRGGGGFRGGGGGGGGYHNNNSGGGFNGGGGGGGYQRGGGYQNNGRQFGGQGRDTGGGGHQGGGSRFQGGGGGGRYQGGR